MLEEAADRYGPPPDSVLNLADYGRIRVMADQPRHRHHRPRRPHRRLKVQTAGEGRSRAARGAGAAATRPHARPACGPQAQSRRDSGLGLAAQHSLWPACPSPKARPQTAAARAQPAPAGGRRGRAKRKSKPGFTKEEILRPRPRRIRAPGRDVRAGGRLIERAARSRVKCWLAKI